MGLYILLWVRAPYDYFSYSRTYEYLHTFTTYVTISHWEKKEQFWDMILCLFKIGFLFLNNGCSNEFYGAEIKIYSEIC